MILLFLFLLDLHCEPGLNGVFQRLVCELRNLLGFNYAQLTVKS